MLAAANRMGDATSFREVTRRGRRAASRSVVVHVLLDVDASPGRSGVPLVGLVVSRAVGNSVVRSRVKRRLRHQVRPLIGRLPAGARVVVRALPAAERCTSAVLAVDLDRCLSKALEQPVGSAR